MDTEHRAIGELLALKDAPDDVHLDQGVGNQSCVKFIQGPSAVPKWQLSPSKLLETVT